MITTATKHKLNVTHIKKTLLIILAILASNHVNSQFIKDKSINVSIGIGYSFPNDDVDIYSSGFYAQGELVLALAKWINLRPYAGFILAGSNNDQQNDPNFKSTANAFLLGGKIRITAPIPWVAPYIEGGFGASIGSFKTFTPFTDIDKSGLLFHIPISLGLELGVKHNFDIEFTYYYHNSAEQFSGAAAIGFTFPIDKN